MLTIGIGIGIGVSVVMLVLFWMIGCSLVLIHFSGSFAGSISSSILLFCSISFSF
jgi:hypothetical protein